MMTIRRRLQFSVAIWLVCQAASLSAFVPRDCCEAHRTSASADQQHADDHAAAAHCPMHAADGAACPMHKSGHDDAGRSSGGECAIRGACNGPVAMIFVPLSSDGVLSDVFDSTPDLHACDTASLVYEQPIARVTPPKSPPPRA